MAQGPPLSGGGARLPAKFILSQRFIITGVSEYVDVLDCFTRLHQF